MRWGNRSRKVVLQFSMASGTRAPMKRIHGQSSHSSKTAQRTQVNFVRSNQGHPLRTFLALERDFPISNPPRQEVPALWPNKQYEPDGCPMIRESERDVMQPVSLCRSTLRHSFHSQK